MPKNRIHKTSDGRYKYSITDNYSKQHVLRSRKNETKKIFSQRCDSLDERLELGLPKEQTFNDLFNLWFENFVKTDLSKSELKNVESIYRLHVKPYIGHKLITDITRADVYDLLTRMKKSEYSTQYIKSARGIISRPYNWAINSIGYNLKAPTDGLKFSYPRDNQKGGRERCISDEDLARILEAAKGSKYYNYLQMIIQTGARPSEPLGLQIQDIKKDHVEIRRGWTIEGLTNLKNENASRDFPMFRQLKQALYSQRDKALFQTPEGWLFPSELGHPSMNAVQSALDRILKQTEVWELGGRNHQKKLKLIKPAVKCRLYDFRHTFATRMADEGMHPTMLMYLMGHSDITVTLQYYTEITEKMRNKAVDILENIS